MNALNLRYLLQQSSQSSSITAPPPPPPNTTITEDDDDDEKVVESESISVEEIMSSSSPLANADDKDKNQPPLHLTSSLNLEGNSEGNLLDQVIVVAKDLKERDTDTLVELEKIEPALELFHRLDEIFVQREPGERGRYTLLDGSGVKILAALVYHEDECMGQHRSFVMSVARIDPTDEKEPVQVFDIRRKRACESVALRAVSASMYGNNLTMNWTTGRLLGQIFQLRHCFRPTFEAESASGQRLMRIQGCWGGGSCNPLWACRTSEFKIYTSTTTKESSGVISKTFKPSRFTSELPLFGARFPPDLDPLTKILIIGTLFHLNITYFERKFSAIDVCILFRYCFVIGLVTLLACAAKLGIIEKIFDNKNDPEPTQHVMKQIL